MKFKAQTISFTGALFLTISVQAASIHGYAVGSYNSIVDHNGVTRAVAGGSSIFSIDNSDVGASATVYWGDATNKSNNLQNSFVFNGNASDTFGSGIFGSTTLGNLFSLGTFDYHNAKTKQDNITAVNFRTSMSIDGFNQMTVGSFGSAYLEFTMSINNTPDSNNPITSSDSVWVSAVNVGMDTPAGPIVMAYDFVTGMNMLIGGENYNFMLMGFSRDGGNTFEEQAISLENSTTNAEIFAMITPMAVSTVPVPAAVWLMGSGLLGLIGLSCRKKK